MAPSRGVTAAVLVACLVPATAVKKDDRPIPPIPPAVKHPRKEVLVRHHPMYGRKLTQADWPMLSDVISRSRDLPLGNRIACLIEGEDDMREKEVAFWDTGGDVYQLTYLTRRPDALYFPNSVINEGRNYLYAAAAMWELQLRQRYLYYIFTETDAEVKDWAQSWRTFQSFLRDWQPAVGVPILWQFEQMMQAYPTNDGVRSIHNHDHIVLAIHSDASRWVLPYMISLDTDCHTVSQWRFTCLANALFPGHVLVTHKVSVGNPGHTKYYGRDRCGELFQNATVQMRAEEAPEYRSCYPDTAYQVIIMDGVPRLNVYVPWFTAERRTQNYSDPPVRRTCDDQPLIKALRNLGDSSGSKYSWCRGCDADVAFVVLQSIVAMKPLSFPGWVKIANLVALLAGTKQDLMVALVAFTVASRLIWCDKGLKASEMETKELKDFYDGHRQHGIHLEQNSRGLKSVEDYVLGFDEGVLYNGIRAALTTQEGRRVLPPLISEENVKMLVNRVKHCNKAGAKSS